MGEEAATTFTDPTVVPVYPLAWRDTCAERLTDDVIADLAAHPERCHPDNRLLLISALAKRLQDEMASDSSGSDPVCPECGWRNPSANHACIFGPGDGGSEHNG